MRAKRLLCLVGFMGSGKTTVGSLLARRLGWFFLDLDVDIVERAGGSIKDIFQSAGEPAFREMEHEALVQAIGQAIEADRPTVIALGGGTIAQPRNLDLLRACGSVLIWLDCRIEELLMRCSKMNNRPLFRDEPSFRRLYEERLPFYRQADYRVEGAEAPEQVVEQILGLGILDRVKV